MGTLIISRDITRIRLLERMHKDFAAGVTNYMDLDKKGNTIVARVGTTGAALAAAYPDLAEWIDIESNRTAKIALKEIESLRNHLAHAQDIATHDWAQIARFARRVEEIVRLDYGLRAVSPGAQIDPSEAQD